MAKLKETPLGVVYPSEEDLNWGQRGGKPSLEAGGTSLYFALGAPGDDAAGNWLDGTTAHPIKITIHYFDVGTEAIKIAYSHDASTEIAAPETIVTKTNTGTWLRAVYTLATTMRVGHDVYEDYEYADFRLTSSGLLLLNEVRIRETALKVKAVWQASEFLVDESYEGTETDDVAAEAITSGKIADNIQSDNYVVGTSGWKIWRDTGDAEFNNVTVRGTIYASLGMIGGFEIGSEYLRDAGNSFGLASTVTGGDDVRFWAGATFSSRATAPFRVTEAGVVTAVSGAIGGFALGSDYLRDAADTFGLASTVTGGNDVRFWAGTTYAGRASGPLQIYEDGFIFAKDIVLAKGSLTGASGATGYGYAVNPLFLCHYDGAFPFSEDYYGSVIGHNGQVGTYKYGANELRGAFRQGIFGKAIQIAEATTNLILNPSFQVDLSNWTQSGGTFTRITTDSYFGSACAKFVSSAAGNLFYSNQITVLNTESVTVSFWYKSDQTLRVDVNQIGTGPLATANFPAASEWTRGSVSYTNSSGGSKTNVAALFYASTTQTFYLDGVQMEKLSYPTPYCDGTMGDGHAWTGTAHASTSTRLISTLTYPASGNINLAQGSVSLWTYIPATVNTATPALLGMRIDANNYMSLAVKTTLKPYLASASGGVAIETTTAGAAVSAGWHHIVGTWSSTTGVINCYVDGTLYGTSAGYVVPAGTLSTFEVGSFNGGSQANTVIDEIAILPIVLTDHETKAIYYSDAPLMLGVTNQEIRLSGPGLGDVFGNANGLFGRGSDGTASFGLLNGTVNATTWGGASEVFDAGDYMFGSNQSGKSNQIFDASAGTFALRLATVKKISLDTAGTLLVGSDISSPSTTAFAVFSGSVTYNGESMAAGEVLIGNNGGANVKIGSGALTFRLNGSNVSKMFENGLQTYRGFGHSQTSVTVTSGNIDLDDGGNAASGFLNTSFIRISTASADFTIRGVLSAPLQGQRLIIHNNTAFNMKIKDNGSPAVGYDKIRTMTGADATSTGDAYCELVYNNNNNRWDLLALGAGVWT